MGGNKKNTRLDIVKDLKDPEVENCEDTRQAEMHEEILEEMQEIIEGQETPIGNANPDFIIEASDMTKLIRLFNGIAEAEAIELIAPDVPRAKLMTALQEYLKPSV